MPICDYSLRWLISVEQYHAVTADDALIRNGHATWYEAPAPQPSYFETRWVTAFASTSPTGLNGADYFMYVTPDVNGNTVTGNAVVLDESADDPEYHTGGEICSHDCR